MWILHFYPETLKGTLSQFFFAFFSKKAPQLRLLEYFQSCRKCSQNVKGRISSKLFKEEGDHK